MKTILKTLLKPRMDTNQHECGRHRQLHEPSSETKPSAETSGRASVPASRLGFAYLASFAVSKVASRLCALCVLWRPTSNPKQNIDTMKTNPTLPNHDSMFNVRRWTLNVSSSRIAWRPALCANSIPSFLLSVFCFLLCLPPASAATRYVWQDSPSPAPPYTSWATAATNTQDAVDAAAPGDTVLVTNGVYATGGKAIHGTMTNRVAVDKPLNLLSVNGPEVTIIQGRQVPGTTNGDGAIRCVYLTNGASLSGFTLTSGATRTSGDAKYEQSGGGLLAESTNAAATNCISSGNSAGLFGGGTAFSTLNNCMVTGNFAGYGGGSAGGVINNCAVTGNSAEDGGGAFASMLNNCTVTRNSAVNRGGGVYDGHLKNCIVYYNTAQSAANYSLGVTLEFCCTKPLPPGSGNISFEPGLATAYRVGANSPCIGTGSGAYVVGTDIDGESWRNPPSIGCDEYYAGAASGPLSVAITATHTNVATGFAVELKALLDGEVAAHVWDFGDGTVVSNQIETSHVWMSAGSYEVVLSAYNQTQPSGVSATVTVQVVTQPVHYVSENSTNPVSPYGTWATAATNIQDAVDAAGSRPGTLILVADGTYASGGRTVAGVLGDSRVAVNAPVRVRSVNGPQYSIIDGRESIRCVYLGIGASLSGFTLTNGYADGIIDGIPLRGGGVFCASDNVTVSNCILTRCYSGDGSGGAFGGTLVNCLLLRNFGFQGAGASSSTLINCIVAQNLGTLQSSAVYRSELFNCTVTGNWDPNGGNGLTAVKESMMYNSIVFNAKNYDANSLFRAFPLIM